MPTGSGSQPFSVDLLSRNEYYPFGMKIDALSWNETGIRYGYNGTHEQDLEVNPEGNYLSFGDFGYDTRVARRFNLDPVDQIFISNYATFGNNPIYYSDPSGYSKATPDQPTTPENDGVTDEVVVEAKKPTTPSGGGGGEAKGKSIIDNSTGNSPNSMAPSDNTVTKIKPKAQEIYSNRNVDTKDIKITNDKGKPLDKNKYSDLIKNYSISDINQFNESEVNVSGGLQGGFELKIPGFSPISLDVNLISKDFITGNISRSIGASAGFFGAGTSRIITPVIPIYFNTKTHNKTRQSIGNEYFEVIKSEGTFSASIASTSASAFKVIQHIEIKNSYGGYTKFKVERWFFNAPSSIEFGFNAYLFINFNLSNKFEFPKW